MFFLGVDVFDFCDIARKPVFSFSVDPTANAALASRVGESSLAVLLPVCPIAFVLLAVRPDVDSEPVLLIFVVLAVVLPTIWP